MLLILVTECLGMTANSIQKIWIKSEMNKKSLTDLTGKSESLYKRYRLCHTSSLSGQLIHITT